MVTLCLAASAALFFSLSLYFEQKCKRLTRELESACHRAGVWQRSMVAARRGKDLPYRLTQEVIEKIAKE